MENNKMYGAKIRSIRILRGFSQEFVADKLGIDQANYSRIETGSKKLTAEVLSNLAKILDVSIADITNAEPLVIQNIASNYGAQGKIENFYADQRELFERQLADKDKEIERLSKQVERLLDLIETLKN